LARVISKLGVASRSQGAEWIRAGRISVDGKVVRDPEFPVLGGESRIAVDGTALSAPEPVYLMVNKPRGLVTTAADERGRSTVYQCLENTSLPWVAPVGRLDKASEGLLLMTNDPVWAARITDPDKGPNKTYHVQVGAVLDDETIARIAQGAPVDGEWLRASVVTRLRHGERNSWLEVVLEEGRNRQIRRLLAAFGIDVLRLIRVAIGPLALGELGKGQWRYLSKQEVSALAAPGRV
jgi:23S rRNA pseudouridine2605 synthase